MSSQKLGVIGWIDLTVPNAAAVRDFYSAVAGWSPSPVKMGDYNDYTMLSPDGQAVAGVCHARGANQGLPPCWLIYITVPDLDAALAEVVHRGGKRIGEIRGDAASGRFSVIQDPAGAHAILFQPG